MSEREMLERAAASRGDVAIWGNTVALHIWCAVLYLRPGWLPAALWLGQIALIAWLAYKDWRITRAAAALAPTAQGE